MLYSGYLTIDKTTIELIALLFGRKGICFSKTQAAKIVGGEYRLEKLVMKGKIRMEKPACKQNGKWFCDGADVIRHIKI